MHTRLQLSGGREAGAHHRTLLQPHPPSATSLHLPRQGTLAASLIALVAAQPTTSCEAAFQPQKFCPSPGRLFQINSSSASWLLGHLVRVVFPECLDLLSHSLSSSS